MKSPLEEHLAASLMIEFMPQCVIVLIHEQKDQIVVRANIVPFFEAEMEVGIGLGGAVKRSELPPAFVYAALRNEFRKMLIE